MAQQTDAAESAVSFGVGRVIADSVAIFLRHPVLFVGLAVLIGIPNWALGQWFDRWMSAVQISGQTDLHRMMWTVFGLAATALLLVAATIVVTAAAFTIAVFEDLCGRPVTLPQCLRFTGGAAPRLLGLSLMLGGIGVVGIGLLLLTVWFGSINGAYLLAAGMLVAMLVLVVHWWVMVPAIMAEGIGPWASLGRSFVLTQERRWKIFALVMLPGVISLGIAVPLEMISDSKGAVYLVLDFILGLGQTIASTILSVVGYHHLRADKEGFTLSDVADVFD